jgi:hypothetical protein
MSNCGQVGNLTDCNNTASSETVCSPYNLSTDPANCYIQSLMAEAINIASAPLNIFKLMGVHEQGSLIDLTGSGVPISSGEYSDYSANNVFNKNNNEWRSTQRGDLVTLSSYIGYDFGPIRLDNGRLRYSIETAVRHHITTIRIQQGCESKNRITRARIERSDNNQTWFGVAIINLPDSPDVELVSFKQSTASRYWRLRPINFNGGSLDFWIVKRLELIDYTATDISNVQDEMGFLENRDRAYSTTSVQIKGFYDIQDHLTNLSRFGIDMSLSQNITFQIAISTAVAALGRPVVVGDIIEVPSEAQFNTKMQLIKKYLEVTDVGWSSNGYTPGWQPSIQRVGTLPMLASQETMDIIGDLNPSSNLNGFTNVEGLPFQADAFVANIRASATAETAVPELGEDTANVRQFNQAEIDNAKANGVDLSRFNQDGGDQPKIYIDDGMPPNGLPYTEGMSFPTNPKDGDYHRLTYDPAYNILIRLYQYSAVKVRWIFLEEDTRSYYNRQKPLLQDLLHSPNRIPGEDITK